MGCYTPAMGKTRYNEPIETWQDGDQVQAYALLTRRDARRDRNGREYLDLELSDCTGSISAKVWPDSTAMQSEFAEHQFVAFRGTVKLYRDQLQLTVDSCRQAREGDRQYGFDEARLVPSTHEDIDDLWRRLRKLLEERLERPVLRRLAEETLAEVGDALRQHPAAKGIHHAYRGGLLEHTVSMAELASAVCDHYRELDRDLVLLGVLFHDIGKLRELGAMPANDYTVEGRLVGHVVMGRDLLLERCAAIDGFPAELRLQLEHLVLSHQGKREYGSPVEPMTAEALTLHFIDDLDAKLSQLRQLTTTGARMQFVRGLGRFIYTSDNGYNGGHGGDAGSDSGEDEPGE